MKKILLFLGFIFLALFIFTSFAQGQECIPFSQSCDANNICCDFPKNACEGGYCVERTLVCGEPPYPCCDSPNPPCGSDYVCSGGYCSLPPTPTPACGMHGQNCCLTPPICRISGEICIGGFCYPETTICGDLGQSCCLTPPPCRMPDTVCSNPANPANGSCVIPSPPTPEEKKPPSEPDKCKEGKISTAIGCINIESPEGFVGSILKFALGIGGGIAVLLIIIGGIQVLTSAGNPEKAKAGQELITSAVSGLLLIIFAVFLLKLIGKDILKIPDFQP